MSLKATESKRNTIAAARASAEASLVTAQATLQISVEWRTFCRLRFHQRVWWMVTGRGPHTRAVAPSLVAAEPREERIAS